jgi:hypothetical protein
MLVSQLRRPFKTSTYALITAASECAPSSGTRVRELLEKLGQRDHDDYRQGDHEQHGEH